MGLQEYKCPRCGGAIAFDSGAQKLKCPFCDTEFDMDFIKKYDEEIKNEGTDEFKWDTEAGSEWENGETAGMKSYTCRDCGGQIVADANTAVTKCPYCDKPVVISEQVSGMLKPDYVIPFKLDKEAAKEKFKKHFSGKKLLPRSFKDGNHIDEIKGIYVPFWLFDADVNANIRYEATKEDKWEDSDYEYERTDHFSVIRTGKIAFDKVPVDGSSKMDDKLMESLEPFSFKEAVPFSTGYLAGYYADKYDVDAPTSAERANYRVQHSTEEEFLKTVTGYDDVDVVNSAIRLYNSEASYALYPVWLLNITWNQQKFTFAMNGQTGKFVGDLPMDKSLFWGYMFRTAGIVAAAAFAIQAAFHFFL
jgi:DNA-directed RNA polymerase subunit RPC12/RpoP